MENAFQKFKESKEWRDAYVESETVTAMAHQIRAMRELRRWSQSELAIKAGTTQSVVSRLEDPSYGKFTLETILKLCSAFDVGLELRFISLTQMLLDTYYPKAYLRQIETFEIESKGKELIDFCFTSKTQLIDIDRATQVFNTNTFKAEPLNIKIRF